MRLGLMLGYSGARISIDMDLVREAEAPGFDSWKQSPVNTLLVATTQIEAIRLLPELCD